MTDQISGATHILTLRQQLAQSLQRPLIQYLLLFLIIFLVYLPTLWYTFIWDDHGMIAYNKSIRSWSNIPLFFTDANTFINTAPGMKSLYAWRPLRNVYFLISYQVHDLRPAGWHLQHIVLHSATACLLLGFFRQVWTYATDKPKEDPAPHTLITPILLASWFAALTWAVHPLVTEVTAWMKAIDDILSCAFGLAALIMLIPRQNNMPPRRIALGALLYAIGLLFKESLVPLVAIYPAILVILAPRPFALLRNRSVVIAASVLIIETVIYLAIRSALLGKVSQGEYLAGSFSSMMATMALAVVRYLQLIFWPFWPTTQAASYYKFPILNSWLDWRAIASTGLIILTLTTTLWYGRRRPIILAGAAFAILSFLPVANIVPMVQVLGERFLYLPLMGVTLAVSAMYAHWLSSGLLLRRLWLPITVIAALIITTELRLPVWTDEQTFQLEALRIDPEDSLAMHNLASNRLKYNDLENAMKYFDMEVKVPIPQMMAKREKTIKVSQSGLARSIAHNLTNQKRYPKALIYIDRAIAFQPLEPLNYILKGDIYRLDDQTTSAIPAYEKGIELGYKSPAVYEALAACYANIGDDVQASATLQKARQPQSLNTTGTAAMSLTRP